MKRIPVAVAVAAASLMLLSCAKKLSQVLLPNQPPELRLTQESLPAPGPDSYRHHVMWQGIDPDGHIDHYVYAVDPSSVDQVDNRWINTDERDRVLTFPIQSRRAAGASSIPEREPHTFSIRAVDDRGAMSEPKSLAFFPNNLPPVVQITQPVPSHLLDAFQRSSVHIQWRGIDPDGSGTMRPVKYKFILLGPGSKFPIDLAAQDPDSLRRYYAPGFAGWDSTSGDTTETRFLNLIDNATYLFVITCFDEVGDYDPIFSLDKNMLRFRVGPPKTTIAPKITIFGDGFNYTYPDGGYSNDPSRYVRVEIAPEQIFRVQWFATVSLGAEVVGYRWVLDPTDLYDESTRSNDSDLHHWSRKDSTTSVTLGPFDPGPKGSSHFLYIEAEDSFGFRSLGILNFVVISLRFNRDLLIVDDTRLKPDLLLATGCVDRPRGLWPSAAELDTFLYARGGVPWQCYPSGTLSTPGIFNGYDYDTMGTKNGRIAADVPLHVLGNYRHVIWYTDLLSATYNKPATDPISPITSLRYMSSPRRVNTLAAYVRGGGLVWLAGGGTAYASQIPWNDPNNDRGGAIFSKNSIRRELVPGRFMYDLPAWQSEIFVLRATAQVTRYTGRFGDSTSTPGPGSPYASLPARMEAKDPATDPLPPFRATSEFYQYQFDLETLHLENNIIEDVEPGNAQSTLDSLFVANGNSLQIDQSPICMTYYHGPSHAPVVFSGMNFWSFRRPECQALVDFVLQDLWHLPRSGVAAGGIGKPHHGAATRANGSAAMRVRARELRPAHRAR